MNLHLKVRRLQGTYGLGITIDVRYPRYLAIQILNFDFLFYQKFEKSCNGFCGEYECKENQNKKVLCKRQKK